MAAGDEETRERVRTGVFTARRLALDRQATGWPTLAKCVGDATVYAAREWLGIP